MNVVPAGNVTSIVLTPVLESPPVGEVVKATTYCVRAPAPLDGEPLVTAMFDSVLAGTTV